MLQQRDCKCCSLYLINVVPIIILEFKIIRKYSSLVQVNNKFNSLIEVSHVQNILIQVNHQFKSLLSVLQRCRIGRRKCVLMSAVLSLIVSFLTVSSTNVETYIFMRALLQVVVLAATRVACLSVSIKNTSCISIVEVTF